MQFDLDFPRAFPLLPARAGFRTEDADFFVEEVTGFDMAGTGEHVCLLIEKCGQNTVWVAGQLADWAGLRINDVGYCGLKDRHAVTRQWFSLYVGRNRELDVATLQIEGCRVLSVARHEKKLRPGMHAGNRFVIRLRDVEGDRTALTQRFEDLAAHGVPNYFGEQRFGDQRQAEGPSNLLRAQQMVDAPVSAWRQRKNQWLISATRAWLFNCVLAERVRQGNWRELMPGEPLTSPTGPMWGRGRSAAGDVLGELEAGVLSPFAGWCDKLEHVGLQQERRPLLLALQDAAQHWEGEDWIVQWQLPPGAYATSVLRELIGTLQRPLRATPATDRPVV